MADMMNTGLNPNMEVYDEVEVDGLEDSQGPFYGLLPLAEGSLPAGQELLQSYRPVDNAERLFRGGFLLQDNPLPVPPLGAQARRELWALLQQPPDLALAAQQPRLVESLRAL